MLVSGWAIALTLCSAGVLFLCFLAGWCGIQVVRFWDHGADTVRQIKLEEQVWLTSALMKYALFFQIISLIILVLAADAFSEVLVGAMCATGAFLANEHGLNTLFLKIVLVFVSGSWLLLNHLDCRSESYPLVKLKYLHLFFLLPLLLADAGSQFLYLAQLEPDILTSCCGVLFKPSTGDGFNLLDPYSPQLLLGSLYTIALGLICCGFVLRRGGKGAGPWLRSIGYIYSGGWLLFFPVALWTVTVFFSAYIYAMPAHRCPFDILQADYFHVGYPIYLALFLGTFFGVTSGLIRPLGRWSDLAEPIGRYSETAIMASLVLLLVFLGITAYAPLSYFLRSGNLL